MNLKNEPDAAGIRWRFATRNWPPDRERYDYLICLVAEITGLFVRERPEGGLMVSETPQ